MNDELNVKNVKYELRSNQIKDLEDLKNALIKGKVVNYLSEPGAGKTYVIFKLIESMDKNSKILIITPNNLLKQWLSESIKFDFKKRLYPNLYITDSKNYLMTYKNIYNIQDLKEALYFDLIIVDESSTIIDGEFVSTKPLNYKNIIFIDGSPRIINSNKNNNLFNIYILSKENNVKNDLIINDNEIEYMTPIDITLYGRTLTLPKINSLEAEELNNLNIDGVEFNTNLYEYFKKIFLLPKIKIFIEVYKKIIQTNFYLNRNKKIFLLKNIKDNLLIKKYIDINISNIKIDEINTIILGDDYNYLKSIITFDDNFYLNLKYKNIKYYNSLTINNDLIDDLIIFESKKNELIDNIKILINYFDKEDLCFICMEENCDIKSTCCVNSKFYHRDCLDATNDNYNNYINYNDYKCVIGDSTHKLSFIDITEINNNKKSSIQNLLEIILENNDKKKLLFINDLNKEILKNKLMSLGFIYSIDYCFIKGGKVEDKLNIYKNKNSKMNLLISNKTTETNGFNLENTELLIIFGDTKKEIEKQMIGRVIRSGRINKLTIYRLKNKIIYF